VEASRHREEQDGYDQVSLRRSGSL
jgi:hypothetical protein